MECKRLVCLNITTESLQRDVNKDKLLRQIVSTMPQLKSLQVCNRHFTSSCDASITTDGLQQIISVCAASCVSALLLSYQVSPGVCSTQVMPITTGVQAELFADGFVHSHGAAQEPGLQLLAMQGSKYSLPASLRYLFHKKIYR